MVSTSSRGRPTPVATSSQHRLTTALYSAMNLLLVAAILVAIMERSAEVVALAIIATVLAAITTYFETIVEVADERAAVAAGPPGNIRLLPSRGRRLPRRALPREVPGARFFSGISTSGRFSSVVRRTLGLASSVASVATLGEAILDLVS